MKNNKKYLLFRDAMTNKFAQLKEEILQCKNNEQLFLLTKEIAFACQHYISIRKMAWKVLHCYDWHWEFIDNFSFLYVIIMSRTCFRVNLHSIVAWMSRDRSDIWSLSDSHGIWTDNHLVCKPRLNHLAKPVKWLSCVLSTYLYHAFDCILLSCHGHV